VGRCCRKVRGILLTRSNRITDGEPDDARIVPIGERAAVTAVVMIAGRGVLHAGDRFGVSDKFPCWNLYAMFMRCS
jgi:hypothetical protein